MILTRVKAFLILVAATAVGCGQKPAPRPVEIARFASGGGDQVQPPPILTQIAITPNPTAGSGVANRNLIQGQINAAVTAGKAVHLGVWAPGVYEVAGGTTGYYSTGMGCLYVSGLPPGSVFEIGVGVTLKLPDGAMTGSSVWYDMFVGDAAGLDFTLIVRGTIDMNSTGQTGWSGGYTQLNGSCGARFTCYNGAFSRVLVDGGGTGQFKNTFANSVLSFGWAQATPTARFGGVCTYRNFTATNFGEGPEIDVCRRTSMIGLTAILTDNVAGDVFEQVNCDTAYHENCRCWHVNGTNPPTSGSAIDVGGTLYSTVISCDFADVRTIFEATTTGTLNGYANRRNLYTYVNGLHGRNTPGGAVFPGEGQSDWFGLTLTDCALGVNVRGITAAFADQHHRFHAPRILSGSPFLVEGGVKVTLNDPDVSGAGIALDLEPYADVGVPTVVVNGGRLASTTSSTFYVRGDSYQGVFRPTVTLYDVACGFDAGTGVVQVHDAQDDASGIDYRNSTIDANSAPTFDVLCRARLYVNATGQTRLFTVPPGKKLVADSVSYRVIAAESPSGDVIARVGTAAASYANVGTSTTFALTTAGQRAFFPTATAAAPAAGDVVSVDVTQATTGILQVEVEIRGRLVPAPIPDDLTTIANFRTWYRAPLGLWQNAAKSTPAAAVGDPVRVWAPFAGTGPDLASADDATRVAVGSGGLVGTGSGFLTADLNLAGPYTILVRVRPPASPTARAFLAVWASSSGWALRNQNTPIEFYENADAASLTLSGTPSTFNVVGVAVSGAGNTTLYRPNGTTTSGNGSSGSSAAHASSTLSVLSGNFGSAISQSGITVTDVLIFDRELSAAEVQRVTARLNN